MVRFGTMQSVLGAPIPEVFELARSLGFDGVELDWYRPEDAAPGGPFAPDKRAAIRESARAAGVAIPSVSAHFLNGGGLASPDPAVQAAAREALRAGMTLCRDLSARVLLVPFFGEGAIDGDDGVAHLARNLEGLATDAEASGVVLGIEHTLPGATAAALLARIASPNVRDYWDMANGLCFGYDPVEDVRALKGHLAQVHAKSFKSEEGPVGTPESPRYDALNTVPFGSGQVPVVDVLRALRQIGYTGWIVLETGAFGDRAESAKAALEVLKRAWEESAE